MFNSQKKNKIFELKNKNEILSQKIQIFENEKQNNEIKIDELILKLEISEQLNRVKRKSMKFYYN
jgi:uncharacterized protein YjcR